MSRDTIYALATAPGRAGLAVIRISGPGAWGALEDMASPAPALRMMALRKIRDGEEILDEGLVVRFAEGASYTGEEMAELHLHGGRAVVARVLEALRERPGFKAAGPGEFTRRALDAGRIDLTEVEGIADLIDAETEAQRRVAIRVAGGALAEVVKRLRERMVRVLALAEASIDFADEEDAPVDVTDLVAAELVVLRDDLRKIVASASAGERLREGYRVAILGAPNAGKSSLLNAIAGREAAITSPIAGTTRDVVEVACDIGGVPVLFLDTAGLRETADDIEAEGVRRAREAAGTADLRLIIRSRDVAASGFEDLLREGDLEVWTKTDLEPGPGDYQVSAKTYEGVPDLLSGISETLSRRAAGSVVVSRARQRQRFEEALRFLDEIGMSCPAEILSEHVRAAVRQLDEIIGIVDVEEVLGEIFARYCIGK